MSKDNKNSQGVANSQIVSTIVQSEEI